MAKRDYYEVLGINHDASDDEIKKAFRRGAVKYHPDKEGGDEAKFKEINEAYEVLKDPSKRQRYDQFGHAGVGSSAASDGAGPDFGGFGGFGGQGVHVDLGDLGLGDIFSSFFGGGFGGQQRRSQKARGNDLEADITLTFEEAVFGAEKQINLVVNDTCEHCKGTTVEPGHEMIDCKTCHGAGQIEQMLNTMLGQIRQTSTCPTCKGRGRVPEVRCSVCGGSGTQKQTKNVKLKIPKGIEDGATIRLREYGEAIAHGSKGDLYVHIKVKPHKKFTREGDLILSSEKISMIDAVLGTEIKIDTVNGPKKLKIPAGTQPNTDFRLKGLGVPHLRSDSRGDHIVEVHVEIPKRLTKTQKELLERFAKEPSKKKFGII